MLHVAARGCVPLVMQLSPRGSHVFLHVAVSPRGMLSRARDFCVPLGDDVALFWAPRKDQCGFIVTEIFIDVTVDVS